MWSAAIESKAWKMILSLRIGKSWYKSLIGNLEDISEQLNSTLSNAMWTSGAFFCTLLLFTFPLAITSVLLLSFLNLLSNLTSSNELRTIIPHILRNSWFCWWNYLCCRLVYSRNRLMLTALFIPSCFSFYSYLSSISWYNFILSGSIFSGFLVNKGLRPLSFIL